MLARVLLSCGSAVLFAAPPSASATPSAQSGFLVRGLESASSVFLSLMRLTEDGSRERLERIEVKLFAAFQSAPKNEFGGIEAHSARYLLHKYFFTEHGWQLTGLEPHGFMEEVSQMEDIALLQEQAPALALAIAEAGGSQHGLALRDVASLVVTLERLVFDQYIDLLQVAYHVNGFSPSQTLKDMEMDDVLCSFLVLFEAFDKEQEVHTARTLKFADIIANNYIQFEPLVRLEHDALRNVLFTLRSSTNPFHETSLTFEDAIRVAGGLVADYHSFHYETCHTLSDYVEKFSSQGLVSLDHFLTPEVEELGYVFTETVDYLEEVGALDPATKRVRLANYIPGPYNCITASPYLSFCCKNECDSVTQEIMHSVQGPEAHPEQIAAVVANISSRYVEAPRQLPNALLSRLQEIAERHNGVVRLHSRLFAQWLHSAFPSECPFPHIANDKRGLQPGYWHQKLRANRTEEDLQQRLQNSAAVARRARKQPHRSSSSVLHSWIDEEVFYLGSGRPVARFGILAWLRAALSRLTPLVLLLTVGRHLALFVAAGRQTLVPFHAAGGRAVGDKAKKANFKPAAAIVCV